MNSEMKRSEVAHTPEKRRMPTDVVHVYAEYILQQSQDPLTRIARALHHMEVEARKCQDDLYTKLHGHAMREGFQTALKTLLLLRTAEEIETEEVTGGWELRFHPLPLTREQYTVKPVKDGIYVFGNDDYTPFRTAAKHHLSHAMGQLGYASLFQDKDLPPSITTPLTIISNDYLCLRKTMKQIDEQPRSTMVTDDSVQMEALNGKIEIVR